MPSTLPDGNPAPTDGALPVAALHELRDGSAFGVYLHVPFCATRCGYCDFNTYTATELGGGGTQAAYAQTALAEVALAARVIDGAAPPVSTVFVGGGTPTLLDPADLGQLLEGVDKAFGLAPDAEVSIEANPESVTPASLRALRAAGFNRISLGMQSVAPHVLAMLDRRHTPGRAAAAAEQARAAGFKQVNLDLIYGTPGERAEDFAASLDAAISAGVDHLSAYSLIVEDGTRFATRVRRGEVDDVDDDVAAERYLAAEARLTAAGLHWYEVSNWARTPADRCRHNLGYWRGDHWWGIGPGAHSHVGGVRWWNVKHPSAYAGRLADQSSPAHAREVLTETDRHTEDVMLRLRLAEGLPLSVLGPAERVAAERAVADGLLVGVDGVTVLTLRGRLLADGVVRDILG